MGSARMIRTRRYQKAMEITDEMEILKHAVFQAMEARGFARVAKVLRTYLDEMEKNGDGDMLYPEPK